MFMTVLLALALMLSMSPDASAQGHEAPVQSPDYRLGPADGLAVTVLGLVEYTQPPNIPWLEVVVSNSGKVHLPFIGALNVNDLTVNQLQTQIAEKFRELGLMAEPQVTVRVTEYRARTIYILGEIMQPGQYYMRENMYLTDLLGLSLGWPTEGIGYLYRRGPTETAVTNDGETPPVPGQTTVTKAIPIDFHELSTGNRPDLNLKLEGGDVFYVPYNRPRFFYATGEVGSPGAFELPPARQLKVSQAISAAGGPTRTAKMSKGILLRFEPDGGRREIALDFDAILRGRKADFAMQEHDIIFIPGSNVKTLGYGLLGIVPALALRW